MSAFNTLLILFLTLFIIGCEDNPRETHVINRAEIAESKEDLDTIKPLNEAEIIESIENESKPTTKPRYSKLTKYFYPNMSFCGGALYGYYQSGELVRIESRYRGEFGYSTKNVEFNGDDIVKITHHQHYADYDKYGENYPNDEYILENQLTFTDTTYILDVELNKKLKISKNKVIASNFPVDLEERLINCAMEMKAELESEKWLVNEKNELVKP